MSGIRVFLLTVMALASSVWAQSQQQPLEIVELKRALSNGRTIQSVINMVNQRGLRFVTTPNIRQAIEESIPTALKQGRGYSDEIRRLFNALEAHKPREVLIAVAPFCGGVADQTQNIQVAMVRKLDTLRIQESPFRIIPLKIGDCLKSKGEAEVAGDINGVHIVVWGEWLRKGELDIFTPNVFLAHPFAGLGPLLDDSKQKSFTYRLERVPGPMEMAPANIPGSSDLIPILIGLSFYHRKDYERASTLLRSVQQPSPDVYLYLAVCSFALKDRVKALEYLDRAEGMGGASLEALHLVGTQAYYAGDLQMALAYFDRALKVDKQSYKTLNNKAITLATIADEQHERSGDDSEEWCSQEAVAVIQNARTFGGPSFPSGIYNHAAILLNCGNSVTVLKGATILEDEYLRLVPSDHEAWFICGRVYDIELRMGQRAENCYLNAIRLMTTSSDYWGQLMNLWGSRTYWPWSGDRTEFFATLLRLLPRSRLTRDERAEYGLNLRTASVLNLAENGKIQDARSSFAHLQLKWADFEACDRLSYRLAAGQFRQESMNPAYSRKVVPLSYLLFFKAYERNTSETGIFGRYHDEMLASAYEAQSREHPTDVALQIGEVLVNFSKVRENHESADTLVRKAIPVFKSAKGATQLPPARSDLGECMGDILDYQKSHK